MRNRPNILCTCSNTKIGKTWINHVLSICFLRYASCVWDYDLKMWGRLWANRWDSVVFRLWASWCRLCVQWWILRLRYSMVCRLYIFLVSESCQHIFILFVIADRFEQFTAWSTPSSYLSVLTIIVRMRLLELWSFLGLDVLFHGQPGGSRRDLLKPPTNHSFSWDITWKKGGWCTWQHSALSPWCCILLLHQAPHQMGCDRNQRVWSPNTGKKKALFQNGPYLRW